MNLAVWKLLRAICKVELAVQNLSEVLKNQNWNTFAHLEELAANIDGMMVVDYDIIILTAFPSFNFYIAI